VADRHHTTVALIKKANNITSEVIRLGRELKISTANFSIVVDKSQNTLTLKSEEEVVKIYPVSTGKDNITPVGTFKILSKIINPPWFSGGKVILPGDPKNILGSRWMGLTAKSYGIHGTTDDASIGSQCTQGCVRMHNKDVEELYDIVPIGTEVTIVD
jgi:lipoprotein-anchoring transpeptidase ErfK/SrfK